LIQGLGGLPLMAAAMTSTPGSGAPVAPPARPAGTLSLPDNQELSLLESGAVTRAEAVKLSKEVKK